MIRGLFSRAAVVFFLGAFAGLCILSPVIFSMTPEEGVIISAVNVCSAPYHFSTATSAFIHEGAYTIPAVSGTQAPAVFSPATYALVVPEAPCEPPRI